MMAWKKGIKGITIYRDGTKQNQPLNVSNKKKVEEIKLRRRRLPRTRAATTHKFSMSGHEGYFTVGCYPDGTPGELFITMNKAGSTLAGLMDTIGILASLSLQYGVPLGSICTKLMETRFEPSGVTGDKSVPMCTSLIDYIFKWIKLYYITNPVKSVDKNIVEKEDTASGVICTECGSLTIRNGTCFKCVNCGTSLGCS